MEGFGYSTFGISLGGAPPKLIPPATIINSRSLSIFCLARRNESANIGGPLNSEPEGLIGWFEWDNLVVNQLTEHVLLRVDDAVPRKQVLDVRPLYQGSVELLPSLGILDLYEIGASARELWVIYDGLNIDPPGYPGVRFGKPPRFQQPPKPGAPP